MAAHLFEGLPGKTPPVEDEPLPERVIAAAAAAMFDVSVMSEPSPRSFHRTPRGYSFKLTLTTREAEVLQLVADGLVNQQIAQRLFVSPETIKSCLESVRNKLDAANRAHAVSIGLRQGFIQ